MGNSLPSSIVASLKGIVHLALILSLSFSSFSLNQVSLVSNSAQAAADGGGDDGKEVPKEIRHLLARLANTSEYLTPQDVSKIPDLAQYKIFDIGDAIWDRVEHELRMLNNDRYIAQSKVSFDQFIGAVFKIAGGITTQQHKDQIERCIVVLDNQMGYLKGFISKATEAQMEEFLKLEQFMNGYVLENLKTLRDQAPKTELPRLKNAIQIPGKSPVPVSKNGDVNMAIRQDSSIKVVSREQIEAMEDWIAKEVVGQPAALKSISKWLYETYAYGYGREKPSKLFLSGLPGTGKDTIARAIVNAKFSNPEAYKEHLYELPIITQKADMWKIEGATSGHVDADKVPALFQWLVKHSGGRYYIVRPMPGEKFDPYIEEDKNWRPGMVYPNYFAPEDAVLYANEVDKWGKHYKNQFFLRAIEQGYFSIGNPGPTGVDKLFVPVNIIFASNDLIPFIASRDINGKRVGAVQDVDSMNEKVSQIEQDKSIFRDALSGSGTGKYVSNEPLGYSEEFINRFKDEELIPLRALGPAELKRILNLNMEPLARKFKNSYGAYAGLEITWTDALIDFMYNFQRNPEEGGRLMSNRVDQLVESTLMDMVRANKLKPADLPLKVEVDVEKNADGTSNLVLRRTDGSGQVYAQNLIAATEAEKKRAPISDAEFADLATLPKRLAKHVYGIDHILEKMGRTIALSKDAETRKSNGIQQEKKAEVFFLLGFSSTGKTETGKALARELFKEGEAARVVIDFNNVHTIDDLRTLILGHTNGDKVIPSKFMQEYDRVNGRAVFMFEEIANAPKEILRALYDILDEPVVTTFADKKPRSMSKVIILATGNNGEKWYQGVPRDVSLDMQMTTMREIYNKMMKNIDAQRVTLEEAFSEAFINRVGIDRFHFYPPFSYESLRKLSLGRVQKSLEDLKPKDGQRGWNLGFKNEADFEKLIEAVEQEGFVLREQGRSIVNFVDAEVTNKVRWELRNAGIPDSTRVLVVPGEVTNAERVFTLRAEGIDKELSLKIKRRVVEKEPIKPVQDIALTSFHEAGHNFLVKTLMSDKLKSTRVTRIPGVSMRPDGPLVYLGMAQSKFIENMKFNREMVIEYIAMTLGGDIAESVVTKNGRRHSGISDDISSATKLAQKAVGQWGLSDVWGRRSVNDISSLSDADKTVFNAEVDLLLKQARALGEAVITEPSNFEVFKELGLEIFVKGDLKEKAIEAFYAARENRLQYPSEIYAVIDHSMKKIAQEVKAPESNGLFVKSVQRHHNVEFIDGITLPEKYANIEDIIAEEKKAEISKVELPKNIPIFADMKVPAPAKVTSSTPAGKPAPKGPTKTDVTKAAPMCNKPLFGK